MDPQNFYQAIPVTSSIASEALAFAKNAKQWHAYYHFEALHLPVEIAAKEPLFVWLARNGVEFQVGILKMPKNTCYGWHVDTERSVGVNMLLTDGPSHCLFSQYMVTGTAPIIELKYQPNTYYIFNTKKPHSVINFDSERYMLSVEFLAKDKDLTYQQLRDGLQHFLGGLTC